MRFVATLVIISIGLASCTTVSPKQFDANPSAASDASLCKTLSDSQPGAFRDKLTLEAIKRGHTPESCRAAVAQRDANVKAAIAVVVVGAAIAGGVAYCSNHECGSGGGGKPYPGNCYNDSDIAADGSRCGRRSAMSRPGGY